MSVQFKTFKNKWVLLNNKQLLRHMPRKENGGQFYMVSFFQKISFKI